MISLRPINTTGYDSRARTRICNTNIHMYIWPYVFFDKLIHVRTYLPTNQHTHKNVYMPIAYLHIYICTYKPQCFTYFICECISSDVPLCMCIRMCAVKYAYVQPLIRACIHSIFEYAKTPATTTNTHVLVRGKHRWL